MASTPIHDPAAAPLPGATTQTRNTTCYMCACRCGIRVHVRDGQVRYIEGNPDHPLNQGVICAKGASGIMKQYSPARLTKPLRRKPGTDRGAGEFEAISWDEAYATLADRLATIRSTDPKRFALFTGRDQMQALTGLFARQFGTPNYAAHGGFCSVNTHRSSAEPATPVPMAGGLEPAVPGVKTALSVCAPKSPTCTYCRSVGTIMPR